MTKPERRIRTFSSGVKKLDNRGLNYIHGLTQVLFMVENTSAYPVLENKASESKRKTARSGC